MIKLGIYYSKTGIVYTFYFIIGNRVKFTKNKKSFLGGAYEEAWKKEKEVVCHEDVTFWRPTYSLQGK